MLGVGYRYWVLFERDVQNGPIRVYAENWLDFVERLNRLILERGIIEFMYRY